MKLNLIERLAYQFYRKVLNGYAKVFADGLFSLETRQNKFESEAKQVATDHWKHLNELDARLRALESKGGQ